MTDIARRAGTSPAAFYQYFSSVEDALQVVADHVAEASRPLADDPVATRDHGGGPVDAHQMIDRLLDFWQRHQAVIRAIDAKAIEGDMRFVKTRNQLLSTAGTPLFKAMERQEPSARFAPHRRVLAGALVTLLTSTATHESGFALWGTPDELRDCLASLLIDGIKAA